MGYDATSNLLFDRKLSHFEVRLYQIIRSLCNSDGYCIAKNQTLANYFGEVKKDKNKKVIDKDITQVKKSINQLVDKGYLKKQEHVKKNKMYPHNIDRVLWVKDAWLLYEESIKTKNAFKATATPDTDKRAFIAWIKEEKLPHSVKHIGGTIRVYRVNPKDNNLWLVDGSNITPMYKDASQKVFDILWANRHAVRKDPTALVHEELTQDQKTITDLMSQVAMLKRIH